MAKIDAEQDEMEKFFESQKKQRETPMPEDEVGEEVFVLEDDYEVDEDDDGEVNEDEDAGEEEEEYAEDEEEETD